MREPVEKQIGEHRYRIGILPLSKSKPMLVRLGKLLGGPLGKLLEGSSPGKTLLDAQVNVGGAIEAFTRGLNEADLDYFCEVFGAACFVAVGDGKWLPVAQVAEAHFAGQLAHMFAWLGACIEVNFADFFPASASGLAGFSGLLGRLGASESTPPRSQGT